MGKTDNVSQDSCGCGGRHNDVVCVVVVVLGVCVCG